MDNYNGMPSGESHYSQQQQQQQQQPQPSPQQRQQPWLPHLLPSGVPSSFPSPASAGTSLNEQHYPPYFQQQSQQQQAHHGADAGSMHQLERSNLSLNLSSLSVTSPTNISPINPSPLNSHSNSTASSTLSPVTPISPSQNPFAHHHSHHLSQQFQYAPPDTAHGGPATLRYDDAQVHQHQQNHHYDLGGRRALTATSSRSSSSSEVEKSVPKKRSFTANGGATLPPPREELMYDDGHAMELRIGTPASYDDMDVGFAGANAGGNSPIDGSTSGGEGEDMLKPLESGLSIIPTSSMSILGKPMGTNNFVTKLYQMINDPKSAHFIAWTDLGTSFVVSNVGEFSRSILGSHFKHNNFSSFVRQLNMYGFHKINRTPRAQRTTTDAQTWEFSHHKFLRGRPDLLDEIKRKALEPDPAIKHRVELPGEVAAQLNQMRDENRKVWDALLAERRKVERLVGAMKGLWDVVGKGFPGSVPPFPTDLLEASESPNIYITSPPSNSRHPPRLSMSMSSQSLHSMHSMNSPNSSPTTADFPYTSYPPSHTQSPHTLSRQHSFQHMPYRHESASSTPLPPSPGSSSMMDPYDLNDDGRASSKRQRTNEGDGAPGSSAAGQPKKMSRARSDSAPLGYGPGVNVNAAWQQQPGTRPRSGSGLGGQRAIGIPNMGTLARVPASPMLSISTVTNTNGSPR